VRCTKVALCKVHRVAKDEAPLCVGVGDLHALPVERRHHVTRTRGVAGWHVLNARRNGVNDATGIQLRHGRGRLNHGDRSVLIHLHL
jgi:hypothetical protein